MVAAPDLLALECANVLWKKTRLREISPLQADETLADIVSGTIELRPSLPLTRAALALGAELDQPIYDCIYVALAEMENADLVTADRTLAADRRATIDHPGALDNGYAADNALVLTSVRRRALGVSSLRAPEGREAIQKTPGLSGSP